MVMEDEHPTNCICPDCKAARWYVNLNYCQVCNKWLGMDDYDGICTECDEEHDDDVPCYDTPGGY